MTMPEGGRLPTDDEIAKSERVKKLLGAHGIAVDPVFIGNFPFRQTDGIADDAEALALMDYAKRFDDDRSDIEALPETDG